jgi:O-antigen/teichoic acid export membrane protein
LAPVCIPVFTIAAINALLITADGAPQQLLQAHHHFHLRNTWQYIPLAANAILLIVVHMYGMPLVQFALYSTLITAGMFIIDIMLIRHLRILNDFHFRFQLKNTSSSLFSYQSFIHAGISFLSVQADRLIIGSILDVRAVTTYTIITKPYFIIRGLIASGYPAFQPGLTGYYLKGDIQAFIDYSTRIIRGTFVTMVCMSAFITAFFYPLLDLWLGTHMYHEFVAWGMVSLGIACLTMIYTPYYRTMVYSDEVNSVLRFSYISVPLNVLISIYLTGQFGFYGVILGTLVQIIAEGIYITYSMRKKVGSRWINIPGIHLIITGVMVASAILISSLLRNAIIFETRTILLMLGYAAICLGITGYVVRSTKLFTPTQSNFPG